MYINGANQDNLTKPRKQYTTDQQVKILQQAQNQGTDEIQEINTQAMLPSILQNNNIYNKRSLFKQQSIPNQNTQQDSTGVESFVRQFKSEVDKNKVYVQQLSNKQQQNFQVQQQNNLSKEQTIQNYLVDALNYTATQPYNRTEMDNQKDVKDALQEQAAVQSISMVEGRGPYQTNYKSQEAGNRYERKNKQRQRQNIQQGRDVQESMRTVPRVKTSWRNKYMKLMVVGESGLGKTTFIRNLLMSYAQDPQFEVRDASQITSLNTFMENPNLYLTKMKVDDDQAKIHYHYLVQDTPGYGDDVNYKLSLEKLVSYLEMQYEKYFAQDMDPQRDTSWQQMEDPRVDAIIFFISPHRCKQIDEKFMSWLGRLSPIIPVIAKADSMTLEEHRTYHADIRRVITDQSKDINLFYFSQQVIQEAGATRQVPPFSMVTSNMVDPNGPIPYWPIRRYEWGTCEVMSCKHSDFSVLKRLTFEICYEDFKVATEQRYLSYRRSRLQGTLGQLVRQKSQGQLFYPFVSSHGQASNRTRYEPYHSHFFQEPNEIFDLKQSNQKAQEKQKDQTTQVSTQSLGLNKEKQLVAQEEGNLCTSKRLKNKQIMQKPSSENQQESKLNKQRCLVQ